MTPARPKQRALLALLLLRRGEVVPGAQLIEALWGEEPPGTAQTALHGHVSSLRKLLGADRIRTRPPGYLLQVSAGRGRPGPVRVAGRARRVSATIPVERSALPARCARALARGAAGRSARRAVRGARDRPAGGAAARRARGSDRRRPGARPPSRAGAGARAARRRARVSRAPARPADARALPLRPAGRRAPRVPERAPGAGRGARHRPGAGAAAARAAHPPPGPEPGPAAADGRAAARAGPLRAQRRPQHRLPGDRRRADRPRAHLRLRLPPREGLGGAAPCALPRTARLDRPPDPLRQARHRALRPAARPARPRDADGRRARGHGRGRQPPRRAVRLLRGRADGDPLRGHLPRADARARPLRRLREAARPRRRLPVGADARGARRLHRAIWSATGASSPT